VDELEDIARITGSPLMPKITIWHALNQKAIARRFAKEQGTQYENLDLIICHLGGGISVAVHHHGRAIDANNALDGEGPFSPERAGTLPAGQLIDLCFSGQLTKDELKKTYLRTRRTDRPSRYNRCSRHYTIYRRRR
jgi:butyrate kinase